MLRRLGAVVVAVTFTVTACSRPPQPPTYPQESWSSVSPATVGSALEVQEPVGAQACVDPRPWTGAQHANTWMEGLDNLPQWRAADVGVTVRLGDGRTLWVFGDTARAGEFRPRFVSSSALVTKGRCTSQWVDPAGPFLANSAGSVCWPSSMTAVSHSTYDDVLVGCSRVRRTSADIFGFDYLGMSIASLRVPHSGVATRPVVTPVTPDRVDPTQINWGSALLADDEWIYIYGSRQRSGGPGPRELVLARAAADTVTLRSTWQYWDGAGWDAQESAVRPVIDSGSGVSQALSVHKRGNDYLAVSKLGGDLTDTVAVWTANSPQGPWTVRSTTHFPYERGQVVSYQPLAHPEFDLASGKLLVSVSRVAKSVVDLLQRPKASRPVFIEVPMP